MESIDKQTVKDIYQIGAVHQLLFDERAMKAIADAYTEGLRQGIEIARAIINNKH